jgi:nucleoid-associated protein EbfC
MQPNMKMLQQMQNRIQKMQQELEETIVEGTAGGGAVRVSVNGLRTVQSVKIDPEAIDPQDVGMLEDMVLAAIQEAMKTAEDLASSKMAAITGGISIPGLM